MESHYLGEGLLDIGVSGWVKPCVWVGGLVIHIDVLALGESLVEVMSGFVPGDTLREVVIVLGNNVSKPSQARWKRNTDLDNLVVFIQHTLR